MVRIQESQVLVIATARNKQGLTGNSSPLRGHRVLEIDSPHTGEWKFSPPRPDNAL